MHLNCFDESYDFRMSDHTYPYSHEILIEDVISF
jgi:hypothetical protein